MNDFEASLLNDTFNETVRKIPKLGQNHTKKWTKHHDQAINKMSAIKREKKKKFNQKTPLSSNYSNEWLYLDWRLHANLIRQMKLFNMNQIFLFCSSSGCNTLCVHTISLNIKSLEQWEQWPIFMSKIKIPIKFRNLSDGMWDRLRLALSFKSKMLFKVFVLSSFLFEETVQNGCRVD